MRKNLANIITSTRILGTLCLIFLTPLTLPFFVVYIWCGLSDVLDGFVARKLKIISSFGSKLDSVSDLLFYTVMMLKIWTFLQERLPQYIWILIYTVVGIRFLCYLYVGLKDHRFTSRHTILNKINGGLMFLLPFAVKTPYLIPYSLLILLVAYISTFNEVWYIIRGK